MSFKKRFSGITQAAHEKHKANMARIAAEKDKREQLAALCPKLAERLRDLQWTHNFSAGDDLLAEYDQITKGGTP